MKFLSGLLTALFIPLLQSSHRIAEGKPLRHNNEDDTSNHKPNKQTKHGVELSILHMNDHHSHLDPSKFTMSTPQGDVNVLYGGFPRMITLFDILQQQAHEEHRSVLKLHAGDALTGTAYYSLFKGEVDADMMSRICFDAFAVGNHEFDDGDANLASFIDMLRSHRRCRDETFVLGANIVPGPESPLLNKIRPYVVKEIDGELFGIVGVDVARKTEASSRPDPGTHLLDEVETADAVVGSMVPDEEEEGATVRKLTEEMGVNKIILLTHVGFRKDVERLAKIPGVDVIIGGDSHTLLGDYSGTDLPWEGIDSYPTMVGNTCVAQAWEHAKGLGNLRVSFDDKGIVTSCEGQMAFPFDQFQPYKHIDQPQSKQLSQMLQHTGFFFHVDQDEAATEALRHYKDQLSDQLETVIAQVPHDICYDRFPGERRSGICAPKRTSSQGGGVANVVAKAFWNCVEDADFAIVNAGGCRSDIRAGEFTMDSAYKLLPFSNTLVILTLKGSEVVTALNEALHYGLTASTGAYPYGYGIRYDVHAGMEEILNVEVKPRSEDDRWEPIHFGRVYRVVTNAFIGSGKDGYVTFGNVPDENRVDTQMDWAKVFIDYANRVGTIDDLPLEEYSTKRFIT